MVSVIYLAINTFTQMLKFRIHAASGLYTLLKTNEWIPKVTPA